MTKKKMTSSVMEEHGIQQLNDFEHIRKRLELYLGSRSLHEQPVFLFSENESGLKNVNWVPAILTTIREVMDNSLDEFIKSKHPSPVMKVWYDEEDMTIIVEDNGRGIPIDYVPETNKHICTMVLTETKTGRNFNDSERKSTIGQNGVGGSCAIIASSESEIEIHRSGKPWKNSEDNDTYNGVYKFTQKFREGNLVFPELIIEDPSIRKIKTDKSGTRVQIKLSSAVFPNRQLPLELIYSLLKEIASANSTHKIYLNDVKISTKATTEKTLFSGYKPFTLDINEEGFTSTFYVVPDAIEGQLQNFHMQGLVNNAPQTDPGTHLEAFKKNFALGIITALEKESKRRKLKPNRSDIEEGLLIYNITKMDSPTFNSQTKTKLTNESVVKPITSAMSTDWYNDVVKKNKEWVDSIFQRCAERTNKKDADEDKKAAKKLLKSKVAKLRDATNPDRSKCVLFLAEGDCLDENTEILVVEDECFTTKALKDVKIGDTVLTHKNNLKEVVSVTPKISETITFSTDYGDFSCSPEHKMMIMRDNEYQFIEAKHINENDMFVRTLLAESEDFCTITSVAESENNSYKYVITVINSKNEIVVINSSPEHKFCVYDNVLSKFSHIVPSEMIIGRHCIATQ